MSEKPIRFDSAMVNAILDGRKTQTRLAIKDVPPNNRLRVKNKTKVSFIHVLDAAGYCPYGKVGDRLWVRETFEYGLCTETTIAYKATHKPSDLVEGCDDPIKWKPSTHMPRWASRINLEIIGIRVERLQDICEDDAWAEGVDTVEVLSIPCSEAASAVYSRIWEENNKQASWDTNPWVWVIEFKQLPAN